MGYKDILLPTRQEVMKFVTTVLGICSLLAQPVVNAIWYFGNFKLLCYNHAKLIYVSKSHTHKSATDKKSPASTSQKTSTLPWRHNERDDVWNHHPHDCLLNRLSVWRSNKTSKLRVAGLCEGNSPVTGEFPAQRARNADNVFIWWNHHEEVRSLQTACRVNEYSSIINNISMVC